VTGAEALARLQEIGARVLLLPDGALDVSAPAGPETEALIDELAAHKPEAVAVLRARPVAAPHLPGRDERPCLACGRQCPEGVLFDTGACFERWKAERAVRRAAGVTPGECAVWGGFE
jgi:hypothetical protein